MCILIGLTIAVSVMATFLLSRIGTPFFKMMMVALVSFAASYLFYWMPVWFGAKDDQYPAWAPLVIGICFVAGTVSGALSLASIYWLRKDAIQGTKQHIANSKEIS